MAKDFSISRSRGTSWGVEEGTKSGGAISRERQCHGRWVGPGGIAVGLPQGGTAWPELAARAGTGTKPGLGGGNLGPQEGEVQSAPGKAGCKQLPTRQGLHLKLHPRSPAAQGQMMSLSPHPLQSHQPLLESVCIWDRYSQPFLC